MKFEIGKTYKTTCGKDIKIIETFKSLSIGVDINGDQTVRLVFYSTGEYTGLGYGWLIKESK